MSEPISIIDRCSDILEKIKHFIEGEDVSISIPFEGLTPKERAQIYHILEEGYYEQLEFEKQSSSDGHNKQVTLVITKLTSKKQSKTTSIKIDDAVVRYFRKYTKLSIPICKHEFIDYYLNCLDPYTGCLTMFSQYLQDTETHESVSKLNIHIEEISNKMISYINEHPSLQTFKNGTFKEEMQLLKSSIYKTRCSLYLKENQNKLFISVDIKKANYNIMNYYHPEIFHHLPAWEEFVLSFCGEKPIHTARLSKPLRERVIGNTGCNKKIASLQEYFVHKILYEMNIPLDKLVMLATDEVALLYDSVTFRNLFDRYHGNFYKVAAFRLVKLPKYDYFVKEYFHPTDDHQQIMITDRELKCIPLICIMQCIKQYEGKPILEIDRKFSIETGQIATLDEPIF